MYGIRRIQLELEQEMGIKANPKRIARIMRRYGLKALIYKGFRVSTTDSKHSNQVYPNLTFGIEVNRPNQLWVTDITYIRIQDGFVFLAVILDIFSRKVVGWAISREINIELCLGALEMSLERDQLLKDVFIIVIKVSNTPVRIIPTSLKKKALRSACRERPIVGIMHLLNLSLAL